jgi:IS30 family transposase
MANLVERRSRFTLFVKARGMELAQHKRLMVDTMVRIYFCDPQSPWQRDTDKHMNRLLRQYSLKGTDLSRDSQADLNTVA